MNPRENMCKHHNGELIEFSNPGGFSYDSYVNYTVHTITACILRPSHDPYYFGGSHSYNGSRSPEKEVEMLTVEAPLAGHPCRRKNTWKYWTSLLK